MWLVVEDFTGSLNTLIGMLQVWRWLGSPG